MLHHILWAATNILMMSYTQTKTNKLTAKVVAIQRKLKMFKETMSSGLNNHFKKKKKKKGAVGMNHIVQLDFAS